MKSERDDSAAIILREIGRDFKVGDASHLDLVRSVRTVTNKVEACCSDFVGVLADGNNNESAIVENGSSEVFDFEFALEGAESDEGVASELDDLNVVSTVDAGDRLARFSSDNTANVSGNLTNDGFRDEVDFGGRFTRENEELTCALVDGHENRSERSGISALVSEEGHRVAEVRGNGGVLVGVVFSEEEILSDDAST